MIAWVSVVVIFATEAAWGQGAFQNLNFEAARIIFSNNSTVDVATTNALPGWSAFSGTSQLTAIPYNGFGAIYPVELFGSNSLVISGNFSIEIGQGSHPGLGSISQTGLVPADARSLIFKGSWTSLVPVGVSLGGQGLSYSALSSGSNYTLYGVDISSFSGQTASLAFSAPSGLLYLIDDIQFSTTTVPEPSSLALCLTGGIIAAHRFTRRRKQLVL